MASFGRERDSLTYLRYGLGIAFLRVCENGKPAATPDYLKRSMAGAYLRRAIRPLPRATTAAQLTAFAAGSDRDRRTAQPVWTAFLEHYKSAAGKLIGPRDDRLVSRQTIFDAKIRQTVENDPKLGKPAGQVWDQMATAYKTWARFEKPNQRLEESPAPGSEFVPHGPPTGARRANQGCKRADSRGPRAPTIR
jgi:hypothetical protein